MPDAGDGRTRTRGGPVLLVLRRALTQAPLLGSVAAVVLVGAVVLGLCAMLLTTATDQALVSAVRGADADAVTVQVGLRLSEDATSPEASAAAATDVTDTVRTALSAFPVSTSTWAGSTPLHLPPGPGQEVRRAYLLEGDDLHEHADLLTGRWPEPARGSSTTPIEVAVLDVVADLLRLSEGSTLVLAPVPPRDGVDTVGALTVTVVGTFAPSRGAQHTWDRDPLDGAGYTPSFEGPPLYGPFVVGSGSLLGRLPVERVSLVAVPDLGSVDPATADSTRTGVVGLRESLEDVLGDRARALALSAPYPRTLDGIRDEQGVVASSVLVAALLTGVLATAALALAGALVAMRRASELDLFAARGAAARRLAGQAAVEALVLAAAVTVVGVPLALMLFRATARLPHLAAAGIPATAPPTTALVVTVAGAALVLAGVLVLPTLRAAHTGARGTRADRRSAAARVGADLVLLALAVLGFLQLRAHGVATGSAPDLVLVAAPVLCLVAGAALALRVLPLVGRLAERLAARSRRLLVPLAAWELARRRHATTGAFLLVLATAAAVFGLTFQAGWSRSQVDQADARVGAHLVVAPGDTAALSQGAALAAVTGGTPTAVTHRPVSLGSRVGGGGSGATPQLIAVDLRGTGLTVGRPPAGTTWAAATEQLTTVAAGTGPVLPPGGTVRLRVTGSVEDGTAVLATPSLVLQDPFGDQAVLVGDAVPLDGLPHEVEVRVEGRAGDPPPADDLRLVALDLGLGLDAGGPPPSGSAETTRMTVETTLLGATTEPGAQDQRWSGATTRDAWRTVRSAEAVQTGDGTGVTVSSTAAVALTGLQWETGHLTVLAGEPQEEIPVVLTRTLADDLGLAPGGPLSLTVGSTVLDARVTAVVPYLPSEPTGPAVLVDRSTLSVALLAAGDLTRLTDTWWVHDPVGSDVAAAVAVTEAGLGEAVSADGVAAHLRDGALASLVWAGTWVLVAAAGVLALAGSAAQTSAAVGARAVEVARLLGLGLSRRAVLASFVVQHAAVCVVAVLSGAVVGAVVARVTAPLLVVSSTGGRPVPDALVVWPAGALAAALAVLVIGSTALVGPVAAAAVRRAGASHLRMDVAP